jgi:hypothetical protein
MRSAKKARVVEEKGQEEEMEEQEERDDENKEDRKPRFTGEDIRNYSGEVERHHVFAAAFADLLPPQEGPLSNYWKQKLEGMEQEIKDKRISDHNHHQHHHHTEQPPPPKKSVGEVLMPWPPRPCPSLPACARATRQACGLSPLPSCPS